MCFTFVKLVVARILYKYLLCLSFAVNKGSHPLNVNI